MAVSWGLKSIDKGEETAISVERVVWMLYKVWENSHLSGLA